MITVFLHGALGKRFGRSYKLDVENLAMAVSALRHQLKGFQEYFSPKYFAVITGPVKSGINLDESQITLGFGGAKELHIIPKVAGAGGGGKGGSTIKVILGQVMMAAGIIVLAATGNFAAAAFLFVGGLQLTVSGVSSLLTHKVTDPNYGNRGPADQRPSFLFNGAVNSNQQGVPVPLVYGKWRTGSVVISGGITTEAV